MLRRVEILADITLGQAVDAVFKLSEEVSGCELCEFHLERLRYAVKNMEEKMRELESPLEKMRREQSENTKAFRDDIGYPENIDRCGNLLTETGTIE